MIETELKQLDNGFWMAVFVSENAGRHLRLGLESFEDGHAWLSGMLDIEQAVSAI